MLVTISVTRARAPGMRQLRERHPANCDRVRVRARERTFA